jgi:hypothetical protein
MTRIRYSIQASVSSTSAEEKDLGNVSYEVVNDDPGEGGVRKTLLAAGATDVSVMMTEISAARFILIKTSAHDPTDTLGAITIKKNAIGGEAITVEPLPGATEAHLLLSTSGITDLFATNALTVDVDIIVMAVGD